MIYGTNILYQGADRVATMQVVETVDGRISCVCPFEKELHSMLWYDAIVLCNRSLGRCVYETMDSLLAAVSGDGSSTGEYSYAYGVNLDGGSYIFTPLK